jgi:hypothetical protein
MYEDGSGVPRDYTEAVKWYRLAAQQGDPDAQLNLGKMYELGNGVPRDYIQAYALYDPGKLPPCPRRDEIVKDRKRVARKMTQKQIAEANAVAHQRSIAQVGDLERQVREWTEETPVVY